MIGPTDETPTLGSTRLALVGREREIAQLREALAYAVRGHGRLVLISGEAGIGKTTLVKYLGEEAQAAGCLVLWGHAYDLTMTPPYGPWVEILRRADALGDAWPSAPAFLRDPEMLPRVGSQDSLFAAVIGFFLELASHAPLVLVLDDLHWTDQSSLDFLRYFARQIASNPILLVATYRSDELHREHPLYTHLPLLIREADAVRLAMRPLTSADLRELIRSQYDLSSADQRRLEHYLGEHAGGNPLYAEELVRAFEDEGVLVRGDETWSLGDLDRVRMPPLLLQVIEGRLRRLDEPTRQLLQMAAVVGEEVPFGLWQRVGDASDEQLAVAVEQAVAAHVLLETPSGSARFAHALFREALYEGIGVIRRRRLHCRVAEQMEQEPDPDPDRLAYHYEQAADQRAIERWIQAAERAQRAYTWRAAAERLDAAARCQELLGVRVVPQQLLLFESAVMVRYADPETAVSRLDAAIMEAERVGDRALKAVARAERGFVRVFLGYIQQGTAEIESAVWDCDRIEEEDPGIFVRADNALGSFSSFGLRSTISARRSIVVPFRAAAGQLADVLDTSEPLRNALLHGDASHDGYIQIRPGAPFDAEYQMGNSALGLAEAYALLGLADDAQVFYDLASDVFQAQGMPYLVCQFAAQELYFLTLPLQAEQVDRRRHVQHVIRNTARQAQDMGPATRASLAHDFAVPLVEGDWEVGRERAMDLLETHTIHFMRMMAVANIAALERNQGNAKAALALVPEVLPNGPATEPGNADFLSAQILQRVAAHIALDQGDLATARDWLEAHDRWLAWSGAVVGRADGHLMWAYYHHHSGERTSARERAEQALKRAENPRQALALVAIHRILGELDTDERRFADAEQHLHESLALSDACLAPFERALTLLATAALRAAQQRPGDARDLLAQVRIICEPLSAKPTLARVAMLETSLNEISTTKPEAHPFGLTVREVDVLRLIAQGLTDVQAAEQLFLSPRTIGTHLGAIYGKLGVNTRAAATRIAVEHRLV